MPSKDDDASRDRHHRSRSERKSDKDREHRHHRSSKSSRSKTTADDGDESLSHVSSRRHRKKDRTDSSDLTANLSSMTLNKPRISMPYPTFSKAHSKEAVRSRDNLSPKRPSNPPTPEPTDVGDGRRSRSASKKSSRPPTPPTPPETDLSADKRRAPKADDEPHLDRPKVMRKSSSSSQATYIRSPPAHKSHERLRSSGSTRSSSSHRSRKPSSASIRAKTHDPTDDDSPPSSARQSSSLRTPTAPSPPPPQQNVGHKAPPADHDDEPAWSSSKTTTPAPSSAPPPHPPPPPPPAVDVQMAPRVDYLLQNGGLPCPVPRRFMSVLPSSNGGVVRSSNPSQAGAESLFAPFFSLLDQYSSVLSKQGSIAVATGHRSVARRLLDRLENVFSRDLPPHGCVCVMCDRCQDVHSGLNWGDVLESVSGRIQLPAWPPFDLAELGEKAAEMSAEAPPRPASPVKMDPDIAEEFREHYLRQSKKVRSAVDKWLKQTGADVVPPPQDVDDETLAFAILTNMALEDRPYFDALMAGSRELKPSTPGMGYRPRNDFLVKCGLALQRLYRLPQVPRDAESATYLVKNPQTHDLLVAMANIHASEWEILTSGRFDGFLWSGADADEAGTESRSGTPCGNRPSMSPGPRGTSTTGSRHATPFSPYSRVTTPASFVSLASSGQAAGGRPPVSNDEEMEIAAAAEMEREIFAGMETLEDAFEKLHHKAEMVRAALRQRGAGLMQNVQNRRRIDVLPTHSAGGHERSTWAAGSEGEGVSDDDWAFDDAEIMPDDSASNMSSSRHRRPKRRTERRTPAPIEEDEEER
ncbi:hypothetical protein CP532_6162 [Ophiocordyceps camponoti-leonardi (nom. inval.)]|nr:hypothetical protein CP532_6162 [Ophiocordyceps camponoti-leonardi (nom. inval.)]